MDNETLAALAQALISVPGTPGVSNPGEGLKSLLINKVFGQPTISPAAPQQSQGGGLGGLMGLFGVGGIPGIPGMSGGGGGSAP